VEPNETTYVDTSNAPETSTNTETPEASDLIGGDAIAAKLSNISQEQADGDDSENNEDGSEGVKPTVESKPAETPANELPDDVMKFLTDKGLDTTSLNTNKIIEMAMNSEKKMNQSLQDKQDFAESVKKKQLDVEAEKVVRPEAEVEVPYEELSPLKQAESSWTLAQDSLVELFGCYGVESIDDIINDPQLSQVYTNLLGKYSEARDLAQSEEYAWHSRQDKERAEKISAEEKMNKEFDNAKSVAEERFQNAVKQNPDIVEDFAKFGTNDMLEEWMKISNIPLEYMVANESFFNFLTKATDAMKVVDGLPKRDETIKNGFENQLYKTKQAEMVSPGSPLPSDQIAVMKTAMQKANRNGVNVND